MQRVEQPYMATQRVWKVTGSLVVTVPMSLAEIFNLDDVDATAAWIDADDHLQLLRYRSEGGHHRNPKTRSVFRSGGVYRVIIPKEFVREYGLQSKDELYFEETAEYIRVERARF